MTIRLPRFAADFLQKNRQQRRVKVSRLRHRGDRRGRPFSLLHKVDARLLTDAFTGRKDHSTQRKLLSSWTGPENNDTKAHLLTTRKRAAALPDGRRALFEGDTPAGSCPAGSTEAGDRRR